MSCVMLLDRMNSLFFVVELMNTFFFRVKPPVGNPSLMGLIYTLTNITIIHYGNSMIIHLPAFSAVQCASQKNHQYIIVNKVIQTLITSLEQYNNIHTVYIHTTYIYTHACMHVQPTHYLSKLWLTERLLAFSVTQPTSLRI
jgi:hypothetical protein